MQPVKDKAQQSTKEIPEAPSLEQLKAERVIIQKHIATVTDKMYACEEFLLKNPNASFGILEAQYKEAERLTKIYQWLGQIDYNRFIYPVEMAKQQAAAAIQQQQPGRIIPQA